jgi:hypothetical protein
MGTATTGSNVPEQEGSSVYSSKFGRKKFPSNSPILNTKFPGTFLEMKKCSHN